MAITITINGTDRSSDIEKQSLVLKQTLSKEPATLSFRIKGEKTMPSMSDTITLSEDGVNIFKGTIVERDAASVGNVMVGYDFHCIDGHFELDRSLVVQSFTDMTADAIIATIIPNTITLNATPNSPVIKTARFNYEQPSQAIQKIANEIGWDWYLDANNVLQFFPPDENPAPFTIEDDNDTVAANSLDFRSNITSLKNVIYIRGGQFESEILEADAVDKYEADGEQRTFPLVYRYRNVQATLDGTAITVGTDFLQDPADYDALYNFQQKSLKFPEASKPTAGQVVRVFGDALIPLILQAQDSTSIDEYGQREGVEIDKSINSFEEAELIASALLEEWREGAREGNFRTKKTGLRVGQSIDINSTRFGVNKTYRINRIHGTVKHHQEFEYDVEFLASGQTTFSDLLVDLIGRDKKNVEISPDEVIQNLVQLDDSFSADDELLEAIKTEAPYGYAPVTTKTVGKYNFSTYS